MSARSKEFTGRHMIGLMALFFGVVIAVNTTMAVLAGRSWTGLVVKNSYVASQQFNEKVAQGRAQLALGWTGAFTYSDGQVHYRLADASGLPIPAGAVTAVFRHPTDESHDRSLTLTKAPNGGFAGALDLGDGQWIVEILVDAGRQAPFRDVRRVVVKDGVLR